MEYFRVDKRLFKVGEIIKPTNSYQLELDDKGIQLEKHLNNHRPSNKPQRDKYLFVFNDYNDANKFWTKMTNGKFYKVSVEEKDILHKGDMNITEMLYTSENFDNKKLCCDYWDSKNSDAPCWEYIVNEACVIEIISADEKERRTELGKRWNII